MKKAYNRLIEQLLLCEPFTERGKAVLNDLGLQDVITPNDFFDGKESFMALPSGVALPSTEDDNIVFIPARESNREIVERRKELDARFLPDAKCSMHREFTLLTGANGSGKTMVLLQKILSNYHALPFGLIGNYDKEDCSKTFCENVVFIDMEHINTEISRGSHGCVCRNVDNVLELFFFKLLETLICYIEFLYYHHSDKFREIGKNLDTFFRSSASASIPVWDEGYTDFINILEKYANEIHHSIDEVFDSIIQIIIIWII